MQGLGAAAVMPLSLTLLAAAVPVAMRPVAIGIWGGVSGLGVALGPVIGGAVVEGVSWQAIFWLNVPVALVAAPLLRFAVPESFGRRQRLDVRGTLMLGGAVFLGIWGIVHGNDDGWGSGRVLVPLVVAALLVPGYVAHARSASRRDFAVLPLRLFASRGFSVANVIGLSFTIGMFGAVFLLAQNLQIVMGYSPLEAGLRTLPWTAAPMVVAPIAGALASRTGLRALLVTGLVLQAGALVWLAVVTEAGSTYASFVPGLLMAGVGMGLTFAPSATAVLDGMSDDDFGTASSANSTIREFGVALGVAGLTAVFLGNGGELTPTGYTGAIGPALLVGAAAVGCRRGRRPLRPRPNADPATLAGRKPAHPARLADRAPADPARLVARAQPKPPGQRGVRARVAGSAGEGAGAPGAGAGRERGAVAAAGGRPLGTRLGLRGDLGGRATAETTATRAASSSSVGSPFTTRSIGRCGSAGLVAVTGGCSRASSAAASRAWSAAAAGPGRSRRGSRAAG